MKSGRRHLFPALLGGATFVGIVLSVPVAAVVLSPGGVTGALMFLFVTVPFVLLFIAAASVVLGMLRLWIGPERDQTTVGIAKYRFEIATACAGASALPIFVFVATEQDLGALGAIPLGALAGWIAGMVQKRYLRVELRASPHLSVPNNQ